MEKIVDFLGVLIMLMFGVLCIFGLIFSAKEILTLKNKKKAKNMKKPSEAIFGKKDEIGINIDYNNTQLSEMNMAENIPHNEGNTLSLQIPKTDCELTSTLEVYNVSLKMNNETEEKQSIGLIMVTFYPIFLCYLLRNENCNYYREESFFKMQNNGADPCKLEKIIEIKHDFTNEQMYI